MIGQNDSPGEIFTLADASTVESSAASDRSRPQEPAGTRSDRTLVQLPAAIAQAGPPICVQPVPLPDHWPT